MARELVSLHIGAFYGIKHAASSKPGPTIVRLEALDAPDTVLFAGEPIVTKAIFMDETGNHINVDLTDPLWKVVEVT